jgi:hypothetical protein
VSKRAKRKPGGDVAGVYPTPPKLPKWIGRPGRAAKTDWERWQGELAEFVGFKAAPWRYPAANSVDEHRATSEPHNERQQHHFQWDDWFNGIGPWLEEHLGKALDAKLNATAAAIVRAEYLWRFIKTGLDSGDVAVADLCHLSVQLGRLLEEIYARSLDDCVKAGRRHSRRQANNAEGGRIVKAGCEERVLKIIQEFQKPGVSKTAACRRALPKLRRERIISGGTERTLLRFLQRQTTTGPGFVSDNAGL